MSFISILESIGADVEAFWKKAQPVISDVDTLAKDLEPAVAIAFPQYSALYDKVVELIAEAESGAASAGLSKAGPQKLAYVVNGIAAYTVKNASALRIKQPTVGQLKAYVNGQVAALNAFEAL